MSAPPVDCPSRIAASSSRQVDEVVRLSGLPLEASIVSERFPAVKVKEAATSLEAVAYEGSGAFRVFLDPNVPFETISFGLPISITCANGQIWATLASSSSERSSGSKVLVDPNVLLNMGIFTSNALASSQTSQFLKTESPCAQASAPNASINRQRIIEGHLRSLRTHKMRSGLSQFFAQEFARGPEEAVDWIKDGVQSGKWSCKDVTEVLLPYLVKASYAQQNLISSALAETSTPQEIVDAALAGYKKTGDPRLLKTADTLLGARGKASWPALQQLANSGRPECRYFTGTIATLDGVPENHREQALLDIVHNPDPDTRRQLIEILEMGALSDPIKVWKALIQDSDDEIRDIASDRFSSLVR